jgi:C4-dicarboxylate transporter DctQ subunit
MKRKKKYKNNFLERLDKFLFIVENYLIGFFLVTALIIGALQVTLRYAFNTGFEWSETVFVLATIFAMFIAGSRAIKTEQHIAVDVFVLLLQKKIQIFFKKICYIIFLSLVIYYFIAGFEFSQFSKMMDVISPELDIPEWIFYAMVPFAMTFFLLRLIIKIFSKTDLHLDNAKRVNKIIKNG